MGSNSDFDISLSRIGESAQRVLDRALEEARRLNHYTLTNEHLFLAFVQIEWNLFSRIMKDFSINPHDILRTTEDYIKRMPTSSDQPLSISPSVKLVLKLALHHVSSEGRQLIESGDIFLGILEENQGHVVQLFRKAGVAASILASRLTLRLHEIELRDERLKKKFELPTYLKHFATNLNLLVHQEKITPFFGREEEIKQVMEILCHRKRPNSPMLIGEPGVGKTAIAEGLAMKIELYPETVPVRLRSCQIVNMQMNNLVAGTMLRGMFEERIQHVIREVKERPDLILFIDEAHTIIGAGSSLGSPSDAANIFKSVMARGEVRVIAATTLGEYKEHIQEDEALARRFRVVYVQEPTIEETRNILYNLRPSLEKDYSVKLLDEAIETVIELSPRYVRHLKLPDKVIGWLDTACVKAEVERRPEVMSSDVMDVISNVAQIPRDMVSRDVTEKFRNIEEKLGLRIIGQKNAINAVAKRLILNKGPLKENFDRPDGVLFFLGPTGVGKTELAKALAEFLFGSDKKMIRIDMSEYQDSISVDKLIGMPRGIVGSERGGVLTDRLRDNPYTVVLLDEIEKASTNVLNIFLQAFDEGWLTDGRGRRVYLSDAIVIMTSNIGSHHFRSLTNPLGFRSGQISIDQIRSQLIQELEKKFSAEFRNRIDDVVIFNPLTEEEIREIAKRHIEKIETMVYRQGKKIDIDNLIYDVIAKDGYSLAFGARFLRRFIDDNIKVPLSGLISKSHFRIYVKDGKIVVAGNGQRVIAIEDIKNPELI